MRLVSLELEWQPHLFYVQHNARHPDGHITPDSDSERLTKRNFLAEVRVKTTSRLGRLLSVPQQQKRSQIRCTLEKCSRALACFYPIKPMLMRIQQKDERYSTRIELMEKCVRFYDYPMSQYNNNNNNWSVVCRHMARVDLRSHKHFPTNRYLLHGQRLPSSVIALNYTLINRKRQIYS